MGSHKARCPGWLLGLYESANNTSWRTAKEIDESRRCYFFRTHYGHAETQKLSEKRSHIRPVGVWRDGYTLKTMTPCNVMSASEEGSVYHRIIIIIGLYPTGTT